MVWTGSWERRPLRITGRDTAQTERILMRLVDTISRQLECLRVIHVLSLSSLVVSASVARTIRRSFWVLSSHTVPQDRAVLEHRDLELLSQDGRGRVSVRIWQCQHVSRHCNERPAPRPLVPVETGCSSGKSLCRCRDGIVKVCLHTVDNL